MHLEAEPPLGEPELAALETLLDEEARLHEVHSSRASAWWRAAMREAIGDEADVEAPLHEPGWRR